MVILHRNDKTNPNISIHFKTGFWPWTFLWLQMSSNTEWLVCGLCGAKVEFSLSEVSPLTLPAGQTALQQSQPQKTAGKASCARYWENSNQVSWSNIYRVNDSILRLCLVCTVKTQTVNEFQEFASKKLANASRWRLLPWGERRFSNKYYILICVVIQSVIREINFIQ